MYPRDIILLSAVLSGLAINSMVLGQLHNSTATSTIGFSSSKYSAIEGDFAIITIVGSEGGTLNGPQNVTIMVTNIGTNEVSFISMMLSNSFYTHNFKLLLPDNEDLDDPTQPAFMLRILDNENYEVAPMRASSYVIQVDNEVAILTVMAPSTVVKDQGTADICFGLTGITGKTNRPIIIYIATSSSSVTPMESIISVPINSQSGDTVCGTITIIDDKVVETEESFEVIIKLVDSNAWTNTTKISIIIIDNNVIYVSFLRFNYFISEGGQEEVCLELSGVTGETDADLWVGVVSQDFNAVGGVDFEAVNETLLFPNGSVNGATACVDVVILDNSVFGKTRLYFWLHIILIERNVVAHISQAFIHIIDNDVIYVSFLQTNYFISEGGQEEVCLELSGLDEETDTGIWVAVVSQDGSAVGGVDFVRVFEILSFPNGSVNGSTTCVDVVILDNFAFGETNLYFWLRIIFIERNVVAHVSQALIHIIDNDVIYVSFLNTTYFISEGGQEEVCLELSGFTGETDDDLWVGVVSQDGNAVGGVDFEAVNETLSFPNGSMNGSTTCVDVVILDNFAFGKTRLYFWLHIIVIERNVVAHISKALIHIIDNDVLYIAFTEENYTVSEGDGTVFVPCVQLFGVQNWTASPLWVTVMSQDGSAIGGSDYIPLKLTLAFPSGSGNNSILCFPLTLKDDDLLELTETFSVHLSSKEDNVRVHGPLYIHIFITDNNVITFNLNTPMVSGDNITASITTSSIISRTTCTFRRDQQDCTNSSVLFTTSLNGRASIFVNSLLINGTTVSFNRRVRRDTFICDMHLINQGVVQHPNGSVTLDWEGTGPDAVLPATSFICSTNGASFTFCVPPYTVTKERIDASPAGDLTIRTPADVTGCRRRIRRTINLIDFTTNF